MTTDAFTMKVESVNRMLHSGQHDLAMLSIDELETSTPVQNRIKGHLKGLVHLRTGREALALEVFLETFGFHGPNVLLLCDIANAAYVSGNTQVWRRSLDTLQKEFHQCRDLLDRKTQHRILVFLGKHLEEIGQLASALEIYEDIATDWTSHESFLAQVQKLRLLAFSKQRNGLGEIYQSIISSHPGNLGWDLELEVQHALILAETLLIGENAAWARFQSIIRNETIPNSEKRLVAFDLLEMSLSSGADVPHQLIELCSGLAELDPYEARLLEAATKKAGSQTEEFDIREVAKDVSPSGLLRLLNIYTLRESSPSRKQQLQTRLQLLIEDLNSKSQKIWREQLSGIQTNSLVELEIHESSLRLSHGETTLRFGRRKYHLQILKALACERQISLEKLTQNLWNEKFTLNHYDRIRMLISRLNDSLKPLTGLSKPITFEENRVELAPNLFIKIA